MPNQNEQQPRIGLLRRLANIIQGNSDDLYKNAYYSDPGNKQQLKAIKTDITNTIKDIMDTTVDNVGEPNISKLYERLYFNAQNDKETIGDFDRIFSDNEFINNLTASYLDNRWVKAVDIEVNEILKYMPKLQEALDTITDNVLSADSFSKDYLNLVNTLSDATTTEEQFDRNISDMKDSYDMLKLIKQVYKETSKYGECFVYCVPYEKAIQKLLNKKYDNRGIVVKTKYSEGAVFCESAEAGTSKIKFDTDTITEDQYPNLDMNISIESGIISSVVQSEYDSRQKLKQVQEQSLFNESMATLESNNPDLEVPSRAFAYNRTMDQDLNMNGKLPKHNRFDQTLGDKLELPDDDDTSQDGLITDDTGKNTKIKGMNGCIVKILKREKVVPVILNDICLGYYYFEYDAGYELYDDRMPNTGIVNTLTGIRSNGRSEAFDAIQRRKELLRNLASELAEKIDNKFIDNNQDLKKEIYYILRYNDEYNAATGSTNNIRVSYIPPEDIHHIYFNLDEDTGRGISDLQLSLIPAKLWVAIYITNCLAIMTRGNDKRVYYVRQSVESNISKTLLKTINEIKKANFGIRQIENINSVLNITGRFNDYIIPRGADGQSPIEFEVMQGQQIEIKTELLNLLEESAINVTGIPIEIIQNRQSPDYAMQLTMSNTKFLRFVYDRQADFQKAINRLITNIYDIEYATKDKIALTLPPPLFINVTNTNQLITNTSEYCDNIANIVMADEQDETLKQKFAKELKIYHLGSYLNMATIKEIEQKARQSKAKDAITNDQDGEGGEAY